MRKGNKIQSGTSPNVWEGLAGKYDILRLQCGDNGGSQAVMTFFTFFWLVEDTAFRWPVMGQWSPPCLARDSLIPVDEATSTILLALAPFLSLWYGGRR